MTTAYNIFDIKTLYFLSFKRRHEIFEKSVIFRFLFYLSSIAAHSSFISKKSLFVLYSIKRYNQHMRDSDENAQQRACYLFNKKIISLLMIVIYLSA